MPRRAAATIPHLNPPPLHRSTHSVRLVSGNNRVPYFVTPELAASHTPQQLKRMDQEIEEIYLTDLKYNCKHERKLREFCVSLCVCVLSYSVEICPHPFAGDKLLQRARNINNLSLRDHALKMPTPACRALESFEVSRYKPVIVNNKKDNS